MSFSRVVVVCTALYVATLASAQTSSARLLVLLRDASALAIIDPISGKSLGRVPTVKDPHEVTVSDDGKTAFVGSPSEGIAMIDLMALKEVRRISPGPASAPHDVLFAQGKLYFTAQGYKSIGRYDPATNRIEWMLGTGQNGTHMLLLNRKTDMMFMPNTGSSSISFVEGVSAGPPKWQIAPVSVPGRGPEGIDLTPDGRQLWAATREDGRVSVIDVATRKVTQTLDLGMKDANRLKITPDGRRVLILDGGIGHLVVLDAASRTIVKRIVLAPGPTGTGGFMIARDGSRAYLGLRDVDVVAVVDLKTLEVTNRFSMGAKSGPGCIAWAD